MRYERIKKQVEAIRLVKPIEDDEGVTIVFSGSWLVIEGTEQTFMTDEEFRKEFRCPGTINTHQMLSDGSFLSRTETLFYSPNATRECCNIRVNVNDAIGIANAAWA